VQDVSIVVETCDSRRPTWTMTVAGLRRGAKFPAFERAFDVVKEIIVCAKKFVNSISADNLPNFAGIQRAGHGLARAWPVRKLLDG
jgi:hypothetical protein